MVPDAEQQKNKFLSENHHGDGVTFKIKRDPRITPFGSVIRKLSIDELPQLWCVLMGDMSLVGPRPPLPSEVARYAVRDRRRLEVKPGLTCIWQVSGRSELPFEQQVRLDAKYIDTYSNSLDVLLLLKTIPAIISGRGAY
jgi:lipopolysaccharide/colanic/teichoic acid biosynthesis glycosyltransferase